MTQPDATLIELQYRAGVAVRRRDEAVAEMQAASIPYLALIEKWEQALSQCTDALTAVGRAQVDERLARLGDGE